MSQFHPGSATSGPAALPAVVVQPSQYLTFMLGAEVFAIGILAIKEIIEYTSVTDVPMMPPYLRGVINLRGVVVPVVDLSVRFARAPSPVTKRTCIVIIEIQTQGEGQDVGVVVDAVNAVLDIPPADIEPPPAFGTRLRTDFIHGMAKVDGKFIVLLAVGHILAFEQMQQVADAASEDALRT
jgi:purine-binding chemotaxis protein CheW